MQDFCAREGFATPREFIDEIRDASGESDSSRKMIKLLCAATNYARFVRIMRLKSATVHHRGEKKMIAFSSFFTKNLIV